MKIAWGVRVEIGGLCCKIVLSTAIRLKVSKFKLHWMMTWSGLNNNLSIHAIYRPGPYRISYGQDWAYIYVRIFDVLRQSECIRIDVHTFKIVRARIKIFFFLNSYLAFLPWRYQTTRCMYNMVYIQKLLKKWV